MRSAPNPAAGVQPAPGSARFGGARAGKSLSVIAGLASRLLSVPVRVDDIQLGVVVDVIFDVRLSRALGLEVRCGDGEHRFLPLAAARAHERGIVVSSPLALLDSPQLAFYGRNGASFRALRGAPSYGLAAPLADVELTDGGAVARLELKGAA